MTHSLSSLTGISRDSRHKRRHTGGKRPGYRKKRKFELGKFIYAELGLWVEKVSMRVWYHYDVPGA